MSETNPARSDAPIHDPGTANPFHSSLVPTAARPKSDRVQGSFNTEYQLLLDTAAAE